MSYLDYKNQLPQDYTQISPIWIFQSSRPFSSQEHLFIQSQLEAFMPHWMSHQQKVIGCFRILFDYFILIIVDGRHQMPSGCSKDSLFKLMKQIEEWGNFDLFNRTCTAFIKDKTIQLMDLSQVSEALMTGQISKDTLFFNNAITALGDLNTQWIMPLGRSWIIKRLNSY